MVAVAKPAQYIACKGQDFRVTDHLGDSSDWIHNSYGLRWNDRAVWRTGEAQDVLAEAIAGDSRICGTGHGNRGCVFACRCVWRTENRACSSGSGRWCRLVTLEWWRCISRHTQTPNTALWCRRSGSCH